ncbi:MAG: hypothetical protein ACM358_00385 [Gemmatimonadota bacterium]
MTTRKAPRRRKPPAPEPEPVTEQPKHEVVVQRSAAPAVPFLSELVDTLRAVAGRMIDIADAAAEAVTRRLEGRT